MGNLIVGQGAGRVCNDDDSKAARVWVSGGDNGLWWKRLDAVGRAGGVRFVALIPHGAAVDSELMRLLQENDLEDVLQPLLDCGIKSVVNLCNVRDVDLMAVMPAFKARALFDVIHAKRRRLREKELKRASVSAAADAHDAQTASLLVTQISVAGGRGSAQLREVDVPCLMAALDRHRCSAAAQEAALRALKDLASQDSDTRDRIAAGGGLQLIFGALRVHQTVCEVQEQAIGALSNLVGNSVVSVSGAGGISEVLTAMRSHPGPYSVLQASV